MGFFVPFWEMDRIFTLNNILKIISLVFGVKVGFKLA